MVYPSVRLRAKAIYCENLEQLSQQSKLESFVQGLQLYKNPLKDNLGMVDWLKDDL